MNRRLFSTPEAEAIKKEICAVGRKLWMRQFVDGNGGNISYRIGPNEVLCTPTLVSKYDLTPEDISLTDLEGNQIAGSKARTSEILLHLEIYKAVPEAKSVVHCHPPHATAYAITGRVPPNLVIPEFEVFVGKVAISPYETPGTKAFAETVLPYVKEHNTVLLSNHGIVCWADTVTHAEWYAEVLETYCWTLMLAAQLGAPISRISREQHGSDLLAIKKKLGLPDIRFDTSRMKECQLSDLEVPEFDRARAHSLRWQQWQWQRGQLGSGSAGQVGHRRRDGGDRYEVRIPDSNRASRACIQSSSGKISRCNADDTMKAAERQLRIRQMFETRDFVDSETLCRELEASESSVRRDLDILEAGRSAQARLRRRGLRAVSAESRLRLRGGERALERRKEPHRQAHRRAD